MVGFELDVTPLRRQVLVTEAMPGLPPVLPMTIDFANGFYFHREGAGLLMGVNFAEQPGFKLEYDEGWLPELFEAIEHRAPALSNIGVQSTWAGLYEVSPDHNALIGEAGTSRASSTRPASPGTGSCRRPRWARSCATSCSSASRSSTSRRSRPTASLARAPAPRAQHHLENSLSQRS